MFDAQSYTQFTVETFMVGVSGEYHNMHSRPFIMNTNQNSLDDFVKNTSNGLNINSNTVQMQDRSMIQVAGDTSGIVNMDDGWNSTRNVFVMVLLNVGTGSKYVVSGFTSADFSSGQNINPYSRITFNTVMELQAVNGYDGSTSYQLVNADNILSATHLAGGTGGINSLSEIQRPTDVLSSACVRYDVESSSNTPLGSDTPVINVTHMDSSRMGARAPELSRATNSSTTDYLSRTARAFSDSLLNGNGSGMLSEDLQMATSNACITEGSYAALPLINHLLTSASDKRAASTSYGELAQALPDLNSVVRFVGGDTGAGMVDTCQWHGRGNMTIVSELASAIPAAMLKLGIQFIGFEMSSISPTYSQDGYPNQFSIKADERGEAMIGFLTAGLPQEQLLAAFTSMMRTVIFPTATKHHNVVISVECSIVKDLVIATSIDGSNMEVRAAGTFASSLWNPVNSTSTSSNVNMATGMLSLTTYLANSQSGGADHHVPDRYVGSDTGGVPYSAPGTSGGNGSAFG